MKTPRMVLMMMRRLKSRRDRFDRDLFGSSMLRRGVIGEVGWIVGLIVAAVGAAYAR